MLKQTAKTKFEEEACITIPYILQILAGGHDVQFTFRPLSQKYIWLSKCHSVNLHFSGALLFHVRTFHKPCFRISMVSRMLNPILQILAGGHAMFNLHFDLYHKNTFFCGSTEVSIHTTFRSPRQRLPPKGPRPQRCLWVFPGDIIPQMNITSLKVTVLSR